MKSVISYNTPYLKYKPAEAEPLVVNQRKPQPFLQGTLSCKGL